MGNNGAKGTGDDKGLKAALAKAAQLITMMREIRDEADKKIAAINDEIEVVLAGGESIGLKMRRMERSFLELRAQRYHGPYEFSADDYKNLKHLILVFGTEELERRMALYIHDDDVYFVKSGHAFGKFVAAKDAFASANGHLFPHAAGADPRVGSFLEWFQAEYRKRRHGAVYLARDDEQAAVAVMLAKVSESQLQRLASLLLSDNTDDDWIASTDRGIGILKAKFSWLSDRLAAWDAAQPQEHTA